MTQLKAITSRDNPLLVRLRKLHADPGAYRKSGEVWIAGDHLCAAFVQRGGVPTQAIVTEAAWQQPLLRTLASRAPAVALVPPGLMGSVSGLECAASVGFIVPWHGPGVLRKHEATVVLDRLQDAGNVGTILRSASAFGFTQVIAMAGTAALWSPKVMRAGMGAHFGLHLVEQHEPVPQLGVPLLATSSHAAQAIHEMPLPWPCAWVLGNEGQGVSSAFQDGCAMMLRIPQPGGEESLNVGAAAAVCLYESARQRASSALR